MKPGLPEESSLGTLRGHRLENRAARLVIFLSSVLVPRRRREEWLEEWHGEMATLEEGSGGHGQTPSTLTAPHPPGALAFALGALPHALWTMKEEWTMDSLLQDLKYAARILRRAPGFTLVAALTLALGIGANAGIFSLVNGLLLRSPSAIEDPGRLVQIARSYEAAPRWDNFSWPAMRLIREQATAFSGVAGYQDRSLVLGRGTEVEQLVGQEVTGNYFQVLGVRPRLGRLLQPDDDTEPEGRAVAVLGYGLWERRFGADPSVVGRAISIGTTPYVVVGVAPPGFAGVEAIGTPPALWIPATRHAALDGRQPFNDWGWSWINVVGRLREGVSFRAAQASMDVVDSRLREADPVNDGMDVLLAQGVGLDPEGRREATQLSLVLFVVVGVVLLLACMNVANLFLARATARRTEVGVRMAMGAGRTRLARQLVTESLLLAALATVLSLPLVLVAGRFIPLAFPYVLTVSVAPDSRVFLFLLGVGLAAGVLFGLAPAWAASRRDLVASLREGASTGGRDRTRLRDSLVVAQLALSLALVAGAVLLGRSVANAASAEPGFAPSGLTAGFIDLGPTGRYDADSGTRVFKELLDAASRIPGVRSATLASSVPMVGGHSRRTVRPAGREDVDFEAEFLITGPDYFETMGIPVIRGRALRGPEEEPEPVVVVNETLADMFWPGEDPVGKELMAGSATASDGSALRVVGVVGDVQMRSLRSRPLPAAYVPMSRAYSSMMALQLRAEPGQRITATGLREAVAGVDPELPVSTVVDLHSSLTASMAETRTIGYTVGAFALLALALAAVGLYGLVAYGASQRVREMGIRIALGARPRSLIGLVLGRSMILSLSGVAVGLGAAYGMGKALGGLLFGVRPTDLPTLGAAALLLLATAGLAAWIPAWRASRVDAVISLRED